MSAAHSSSGRVRHCRVVGFQQSARKTSAKNHGSTTELLLVFVVKYNRVFFFYHGGICSPLVWPATTRIKRWRTRFRRKPGFEPANVVCKNINFTSSFAELCVYINLYIYLDTCKLYALNALNVDLLLKIFDFVPMQFYIRCLLIWSTAIKGYIPITFRGQWNGMAQVIELLHNHNRAWWECGDVWRWNIGILGDVNGIWRPGIYIYRLIYIHKNILHIKE